MAQEVRITTRSTRTVALDNRLEITMQRSHNSACAAVDIRYSGSLNSFELTKVDMLRIAAEFKAMAEEI